jgi:hypothetical protein
MHFVFPRFILVLFRIFIWMGGETYFLNIAPGLAPDASSPRALTRNLRSPILIGRRAIGQGFGFVLVVAEVVRRWDRSAENRRDLWRKVELLRGDEDRELEVGFSDRVLVFIVSNDLGLVASAGERMHAEFSV